MLVFLFVIACWGVWYLAPERVDLLIYDRQAIIDGQWWRLWSAQLTHQSRVQLIVDSAVLFVLGLILSRYVKFRHLMIGFIFAMPVMMWLLFVFMPDVQVYRGATGLAAMVWMMSGWFLIIESKSRALKFLVGYPLLLILLGKIFIEGLAVWTPYAVAGEGLKLVWMMQCFGALLGIALFTPFDRLYLDRIYLDRRHPRRRPPVTLDGKPIPLPLNAPRPVADGKMLPASKSRPRS